MKPRYRLVAAHPAMLIFENVNTTSVYGKELYALPRHRFQSGRWAW